jgi:transposase
VVKLVKVKRKTLNNYYKVLRETILKETLKETPRDDGGFELEEPYFGAKRVRGKRGRGAAGKTPVFGLAKRGGKVFVKIVKTCSKEELLPVIQGKILEKSVVYTDGWKAYDGLILNGYDYYRVYHSGNEFARGKNRVNGIENFWSYAKRRLSKFNGCTSEKFVLLLKECEFRYNHRNEVLLKLVTKIFKR